MAGPAFDPGSFFNTPKVTPPVVSAPSAAPKDNFKDAVDSVFGAEKKSTPFGAPAAAAPAPTAASTAPASTVAEEKDDDFASSMQVDLGTRVSKYPISKFRGVQNFTRRVGILTSKWYAVKTHYLDGHGSFYCFGGSCCDFSDPMVRYLAPIIVYDTGADGEPISQKFKIEFLGLSDSQYGPLILMNKGQALDTIDIFVSCTDAQYQKVSFIPAGPALWRTNEVFAKAVWVEYVRLEKFIVKAFARRLGTNQVEAEASFAKLRTGEDKPAAGAAVSSFDLTKFSQQ